MKKETPKYCPESHKYCYSSEAKAQRALNRYEEIERIYYCEYCDSWHTTSMDQETSKSFGYIEEKIKITKKEVRKRLKYLLNLQK